MSEFVLPCINELVDLVRIIRSEIWFYDFAEVRRLLRLLRSISLEGVMIMQSKEFGYARVSTTHQNTDRQIEALKEYGIDERDIIIDKQSGKDFNRQGYITLKNSMLRSGDTLVIKELDRLGRNKQMIKEELEWFKAHNIRVKILNVPTSLIDVEGQDWVMEMVSNILIEVMSSIAEEERLKNHQRQREGIDAARAKGVTFGRPTIAKPEAYDIVMQKVQSGEMKSVDAMKELGVRKTSFYKLKKMYCN